jgi:hypothetical protein
MIVVVSKRRMNLSERQMRMLQVNLLRAVTVRQMIKNDLDNLATSPT